MNMVKSIDTIDVSNILLLFVKNKCKIIKIFLSPESIDITMFVNIFVNIY